MKVKRQLRYLLDRSYFDCLDSRCSEVMMPLLLTVDTSGGDRLLTDGINSVRAEQAKGAGGLGGAATRRAMCVRPPVSPNEVAAGLRAEDGLEFEDESCDLGAQLDAVARARSRGDRKYRR